jgi:cell wall-associated NlpC family hydrolase
VEYTELKPGDVLFFRATSWLVRLFVRYRHVAVYFDETKRGLPLIVESIGRGVLIRSLFSYTGEEITVKRPADESIGPLAAKAAERLADNPSSWYGYFDIPRFAVPKLILAKFGSVLPKNWDTVLKWLAFTYRRNSYYICSELVESAFKDAGYPLVDEETIPLPDDLFNSPRLTLVGTVKAEGGA